MQGTSERARFQPVANEERGRLLRERRIRAGIKSIRAFVEATKRYDMPVSREAITAAEEGRASDTTYDRLDAFLARWEEETGHDEDEMKPDEAGLVTFRVHGNFGVDVVVQGPVGDADEIERVVEKLIRGMQTGKRE